MSLEAPIISAQVVQWLYSEAVGIADTMDLIDELCRRLNTAHVPVDRFTTAIPLLHPNVRAESALWTREGVNDLRRYLDSDATSESYNNSPMKVIFEEQRPVRVRISDIPEENEFGIVPELRADGYKDYVALPMPFSDGSLKALTLATRAPDGFSPTHMAVFESIIGPLATVCELNTLRRTAHTLLDTYVGPRAGGRVLDGTIKRGEGEWISAVVGFTDLRNFTGISNVMPADKLVTFLNNYFGAVAGAVEAQGGEVLKYIGDEVMAIFPYANKEEASTAAKRALIAARDATKRIDAINQGNQCTETPDIKVGIALHAGDLFFGNVGSETRLDFTVIGPVVNLAARIAELAKDLGSEILVSDAIADIMGCRSGLYGQYQVKGFDEPVSVYSPSLSAIDTASWCPDNAEILAREAN